MNAKLTSPPATAPAQVGRYRSDAVVEIDHLLAGRRPDDQRPQAAIGDALAPDAGDVAGADGVGAITDAVGVVVEAVAAAFGHHDRPGRQPDGRLAGDLRVRLDDQPVGAGREGGVGPRGRRLSADRQALDRVPIARLAGAGAVEPDDVRAGLGLGEVKADVRDLIQREPRDARHAARRGAGRERLGRAPGVDDAGDVGPVRGQRAEVDVGGAPDAQAGGEPGALRIGAVHQRVGVVIDAVVAGFLAHDRPAGEAAHAVVVRAVDAPVVVVVERVVADLLAGARAAGGAEAGGIVAIDELVAVVVDLVVADLAGAWGAARAGAAGRAVHARARAATRTGGGPDATLSAARAHGAAGSRHAGAPVMTATARPAIVKADGATRAGGAALGAEEVAAPTARCQCDHEPYRQRPDGGCSRGAAAHGRQFTLPSAHVRGRNPA